MKKSASERFWMKVTSATTDHRGCWDWASAKTDCGYGSFWDGTRKVYAHRWSYEQLRAEIPEGLCIDHLCQNRACVNPWHLEPVTTSVNIRRGRRAEVRRAQMPPNCPHGHPYSGDNLIISTPGWRVCRACEVAKNERRKAARHAERRNT